MSLNQNRKNGFSYFVDDATRHRYANLKPEEKLQWLAEATDLIYKASSPENSKIRRKFREGKI